LQAPRITGEVVVRRSQPLLFNASDVIGMPPAQFERSCINIADDVLRGQTFAVEDWAAVAERLRALRLTVLAKCFGFVQWVRDRVEELESALIPTITFLGRSPRRMDLIEVSQAGASGRREVTSSVARMLRDFARSGRTTCLRKHRMSLLKAIPEMGPWIVTDSTSLRTHGDNQGTYSVVPDLRSRIQTHLPRSRSRKR
jgi:hypothetical protein